MIINFRYHIFTITAIFAALGLGILIGSSIIGHEGLLEEQRHIIKNISNDINKLKKENKNLTFGISILEQKLTERNTFEKSLVSLLLTDYMKEEQLILVYSDLEEENVNELSKYLKIMGANFNLFNYKHLEKDSLSLENQVNKEIDRFITWNVNTSLKTKLDGLKLSDKAILEYNQSDVMGLLLNIINDFNENKQS